MYLCPCVSFEFCLVSSILRLCFLASLEFILLGDIIKDCLHLILHRHASSCNHLWHYTYLYNVLHIHIFTWKKRKKEIFWGQHWKDKTNDIIIIIIIILFILFNYYSYFYKLLFLLLFCVFFFQCCPQNPFFLSLSLFFFILFFIFYCHIIWLIYKNSKQKNCFTKNCLLKCIPSE